METWILSIKIYSSRRQPEQVKLGLGVRDLNDSVDQKHIWKVLNVSNIEVHPEFRQ